MNRCILHVGMPKTGTSSIQKTLYYGLDDPRYRYFAAGEITTSYCLVALAREGTLPFHSWGARGNDTAFVERTRRCYSRKLARCLRQVGNSGAALILSGEGCWIMTHSELSRLKALLNEGGFEVEVIAYVRHWKGYLESNAQQRVQLLSKFGGGKLPPMLQTVGAAMDYRQRIETLEAVFGRDRVRVRKFAAKEFPGGCVVRDFCHQVGITIDEKRIHEVNESLSMDAVRFLECYRRYGNRERSSGFWPPIHHHWLVTRLRSLRGPAFRIHSSVIEPMLEGLLEQRPWLEERLGAPFDEDLRKHDEGDCFREEEDLYRFREESLRWLVAQTGASQPLVGRGEALARQVGALIHRLRHQVPSRSILAASAASRFRMLWTRYTRGR